MTHFELTLADWIPLLRTTTHEIFNDNVLDTNFLDSTSFIHFFHYFTNNLFKSENPLSSYTKNRFLNNNPNITNLVYFLPPPIITLVYRIFSIQGLNAVNIIYIVLAMPLIIFLSKIKFHASSSKIYISCAQWHETTSALSCVIASVEPRMLPSSYMTLMVVIVFEGLGSLESTPNDLMLGKLFKLKYY